MSQMGSCGSNNHHERGANIAASLSSQESTYGTNQELAVVCTENADTKAKHDSCLDLVVASEAAKEEETTPLSGNPYFTSIMAKSQVQKPFQMLIPSRFHSYLPKARVPVVLLYRDKPWTMNYCGDIAFKRFDMGWKGFAIDNKLRIGDACVFELLDKKDLTFRVQILRGDLPEEFISNGSTFDKPIVIID